MTTERTLALESAALLLAYRTMNATQRRDLVRSIHRQEIGSFARRAGLRFLALKADAEARGTL